MKISKRLKKLLKYRNIRIEDLIQPSILLTDLIHLPEKIILQDSPKSIIRNDLSEASTNRNKENENAYKTIENNNVQEKDYSDSDYDSGTISREEIKKNENIRASCNIFENRNEQEMGHSKVNYDGNYHDDDSESTNLKKADKSSVHDLSCETFSKRGAKLGHVLNYFDDPKPQVNEFIFMCTRCDFRFKTYQDLEQHFIDHEENEQFVCTKCGKSYSRRYSLKRHYKKKHYVKSFKAENTNKSYICDTCGVPYMTSRHLNQHIIKLHVEGAFFTCKTCRKSFLSKIRLDKHLKMHEKKKKLICADCLRSFSSKRNLIYHVTVHMGITPFKCDTCGAGFRRKANLNTHKMIHTGERPFKCVNCEASFTRRTALAKHVQKSICCKCQILFYCITNFRKHAAEHSSM